MGAARSRNVPRRFSGHVALGSLGILVLGVLPVGAAVAQVQAPGATVTAPAPPASSGALTAVAAVPHSSDVWTIGAVGRTLDHQRFFVARRHDGQWQRLTTPNLGGRFGNLNAVAAASPKSIWIAGGKRVRGQQDAPAIWRWTGKRFVAQKLPKLVIGAASITAMSASSARDAWAIGPLYLAHGGPVALHWNGKKWSGVPVPVGQVGTLTSISASSSSNAWALSQFGVLLHWNGKAWSERGKAPGEVGLDAVATSSPKLAYAVGSTLASNARFRTAILRFNGKKWSRVALAKGIRYGALLSITMHGRSAWAVGFDVTAGEFQLPVLLHSTGGAWRSQQTLGRAYSLSAVSTGTGKYAFAVGSYVQGTVVQKVSTFFDLFNGHSWTGAPSVF
jgi:hypothetical protein